MSQPTKYGLEYFAQKTILLENEFIKFFYTLASICGGAIVVTVSFIKLSDILNFSAISVYLYTSWVLFVVTIILSMLRVLSSIYRDHHSNLALLYEYFTTDEEFKITLDRNNTLKKKNEERIAFYGSTSKLFSRLKNIAGIIATLTFSTGIVFITYFAIACKWK